MAKVQKTYTAEFKTAHRPNEKWTGDITAVWTRCRLALCRRGSRSLLTARDWMGHGSHSRGNVD